jgi:hypothetical protein
MCNVCLPVGKPSTLLLLLNHITCLKPSMALALNPTVYFLRCLLHWKENRSTLKLRSLMHLSIITSCLVIAGLMQCASLCLPFSVLYVFHIRERSLLSTS